MSKKLNVAELFAGVGGFRVGLERVDSSFFKTVYANQWEPSTKIQHAYDCYVSNFGKSNKNQIHENENISIVNDRLKNDSNYIPFKIDLIVAGFPCQDYSVATTKSKGLQGKKGVLWWEIEKFLIAKKPNYLLLENVDRLLISPIHQRGRDFLVMLSILNKHNYNVEWRILNASEYGFVQRRKRVFVFAQKQESNIDKNVNLKYLNNNSVLTWNLKIIKTNFSNEIDISKKSIQKLSDNEKFNFYNYGYMINGKITTVKVNFDYNGEKKFLNDILEKKISKEFYLNSYQKEKIFLVKDGGRKERTTKDGFKYFYSEGKMSRYDNIYGKPGRTMLTSEGTINRSTHIIKEGNKYRFITPIEAERLNGFDDNWTKSISSKNKRYFVMGNSLVTNLVEKIGESIKYWETKK